MSTTGAAGDDRQFDTDWLVIGSGFGGSVSALRLAEKGHRVLVLERGEHFDDDDMPRSSWDLRRYFYAPRLGLRGHLQDDVLQRRHDHERGRASAAAASSTR